MADQININNFLGVEFEQYKAKIIGVAVQSPAQYYQLRADVIADLSELVSSLNTKLNALLSEGTLTNTGGAHQNLTVNGVELKPKVVKSERQKIVIGICKSLHASLEDVIDILLPTSLEKVISGKLISQANKAFCSP